MILLSIVFVVVASIVGSISDQKPSTPTAAKKPSLRQTQDLVDQFVAAGLVTKIDENLQDVYVDPWLWHSTPLDSKRDITLLMARYFMGKKGSELVAIKDRMNGKTLAKNGVLGLKVYE